MLDESEFTRWSAAAEDARKAASVQADAGGHNWACFLAEQGAQLAIKGLLHGVGASAWGHDLVALGSALSNQLQSPLPPKTAAALRRLSRHYIPARYPDAHPSGPPSTYYGAEDAHAALADADHVLSFVANAWLGLQESASEQDDERAGDS